MTMESPELNSGKMEGEIPPFLAGHPNEEKDFSLKKIPVIDDRGGVIGLANSEQEANEMYRKYREELDLQ